MQDAQLLSKTSSTLPSPADRASAASDPDADDVDDLVDAKAEKRMRNTLAARKYRQKRLDRITELEQALEAMTKDRDDLKMRLAREEAQNKILKEVLGAKAKD